MEQFVQRCGKVDRFEEYVSSIRDQCSSNSEKKICFLMMKIGGESLACYSDTLVI
jgi:hypothetical protein